MTLEELIRESAVYADSEKMDTLVHIISESIDTFIGDEAKDRLLRQVYGIIGTGHYNEHFAKEQIADMYYIDKYGEKMYAPYWTTSALKDIYNSVKDKIPAYNLHDFIVTMNMVKSDECQLLRRWFPEATEEDLQERITEAAVNWLCDDDTHNAGTKIWCYYNG